MRSGKRAVLLRIYPACVYERSTLRITHWVVVFTAISEALDRVRAIDFVSALGRESSRRKCWWKSVAAVFPDNPTIPYCFAFTSGA
jgi:hypothetical protein